MLILTHLDDIIFDYKLISKFIDMILAFNSMINFEKIFIWSIVIEWV